METCQHCEDSGMVKSEIASTEDKTAVQPCLECSKGISVAFSLTNGILKHGLTVRPVSLDYFYDILDYSSHFKGKPLVAMAMAQALMHDDLSINALDWVGLKSLIPNILKDMDKATTLFIITPDRRFSEELTTFIAFQAASTGQHNMLTRGTQSRFVNMFRGSDYGKEAQDRLMDTDLLFISNYSSSSQYPFTRLDEVIAERTLARKRTLVISSDEGFLSEESIVSSMIVSGCAMRVGTVYQANPSKLVGG